MSTSVTSLIDGVGCAQCHVLFGLEADYKAARRRDHEMFYCPNGHLNHYPQQSEEERLADALTRERANHDQTRAALADKERARKHHENRARVLKGHHTRLKRRVAHGVCPRCNRTFQNVARHMAGKHPSYVEAVVDG